MTLLGGRFSSAFNFQKYHRRGRHLVPDWLWNLDPADATAFPFNPQWLDWIHRLPLQEQLVYKLLTRRLRRLAQATKARAAVSRQAFQVNHMIAGHFQLATRRDDWDSGHTTGGPQEI